MERRECIIKFHLYSVDPKFQVPNMDEFGIDSNSLNVNIASTWIEDVIKIMHKIRPNWQYDPTEAIRCPFLSRMIFYDSIDQPSVQFAVSFLIDTNPWPQKDLELCNRERDELAKNDGTGQVWWIHHITLSTGEIIDCDDGITYEVDRRILACIEGDLSEFVVSLG